MSPGSKAGRVRPRVARARWRPGPRGQRHKADQPQPHTHASRCSSCGDATAVSGWFWADLPPVPVVGQLVVQLAVNDVPGQRLWVAPRCRHPVLERNRTPLPAALAISASCSSAKKNLVPSV